MEMSRGKGGGVFEWRKMHPAAMKCLDLKAGQCSSVVAWLFPRWWRDILVFSRFLQIST